MTSLSVRQRFIPHKALFLVLPIVVAATLLTPLAFQRQAFALTGSDFNPGHIIDDVVFTNSNAMSVQDIQNFLNAKVPTCSTNHTGFTGGTGTVYNPPFVCLKDFYENPTSTYTVSFSYTDTGGNAQTGLRTYYNNNAYKVTALCPVYGGYSGTPTCGSGDYHNGLDHLIPTLQTSGLSTPSGAQSAAQIIYNAAQQYNINPQVLIVTLQKEQGLVTDDWPASYEYQEAMGYGCPDTAPCSSNYAGFSNQIISAAWQFRHYLDYPNNYNYVVGTDYILYNPDSSCGGSNVNIQNQATAALYDYTPYQPNAAALSGVSDSSPGGTVTCGAYGNRNFWWYFNEWFGNSLAPNYSEQYVSQAAYPQLNPGDSTTVYVTYKNVGNMTWYDDTAINGGTAPSWAHPTRLGTDNPQNRSSAFGSTWGGDQNRATGVFDTVYDTSGNAYSTNPHAVKPGESVKFSFTLSVPANYTAGAYTEWFRPVTETVGYMGGSGVYLNVTVNPVYTASYVGQSAYPTIAPGDSTQAYFTYKNTSNTPWYDNVSAASHNASPTRLATTNPVNRSSAFGSTWGGDQNRATGVFDTVYDTSGNAYGTNPHIVKPGESAKFSFTLSAPDNYTAGSYNEYFAPLTEGYSAMPITTFLTVTVPTQATAKATTPSISTTMNPLATGTQTVTFKNSGNTTWSSSNITLAASGDTDKLHSSSWVSSTVPATMQEGSVAPGSTGTFIVPITTPPTGGTYNLKLSVAQSGTDIGLSSTTLTVNVNSPQYNSQYFSESAYPTINQNDSANAYFMYKNTGNIPWYDVTTAAAAGTKPVVLAAGNPVNRMSSFNAAFATPNRPAITFAAVYEGDGTTLAADQHVTQPGQIVKFSFPLVAPRSLTPGTYREWFQPLVEGGNPAVIGGWAYLDVTVKGMSFNSLYAGESSYPTVAPGGTAQAYFMYKNTGTAPWHDVTTTPQGTSPLVLATANPINRMSSFNAAFATPNRPAITFAAVYESDGTTLAADQHTVQPGQIVKFAFTFTAPQNITPGTYREWFQPILEGANPPTLGGLVYLDVTVQP